MADDEVPPSLWEWARSKGLEEYNAVLVQVYDEPASQIEWHCDKTRVHGTSTKLCEGYDVISFSFAKRPCDEGVHLATMEFGTAQSLGYKSSAPEAIHPSTVSERIELFHGSCVRFDPYADEQRLRKHRVPATIKPRINVTFRRIVPRDHVAALPSAAPRAPPPAMGLLHQRLCALRDGAEAQPYLEKDLKKAEGATCIVGAGEVGSSTQRTSRPPATSPTRARTAHATAFSSQPTARAPAASR